MKIAIIIGVTKYVKPVSDLPACKNDVDLIAALLHRTGKYEGNFLQLTTDTSSTTVKSEVAQFIAKYKGQTIEELFFYYSGHGELHKDDFYFLLSDYSDTKRNQTALSTEELDAMLRSLSPRLTVKVVDACHAGVTYIKEADALAKSLEQSKGRFGNCYFMFSSQADQKSFQDENLSDFTKAFIDACVTFSGKEIRYSDIIAYTRDQFSGNTDQTPTFVTQATHTEIFCSVDDAIRNLVDKKPATETKEEAKEKPSEAPTILQLVKAKAEEYCTREEATTYFAGLRTFLEQARLTGEFAELYGLQSDFEEGYGKIGKMHSVGKWMHDNKGDYFVQITYESEQYYGLVRDPLSLAGSRQELKTRQVIAGAESTATTPYRAIRISAQPKYENLPHANASIVFFFSKKDCVFFYLFQVIKESDWGKLTVAEGDKWFYQIIKMRTDLSGKETGARLLHSFEEFLEGKVKEKLGLIPDTEDQQKPKTDDIPF